MAWQLVTSRTKFGAILKCRPFVFTEGYPSNAVQRHSILIFCLLNLFVCHSFSPLVEEADDLARDVLAAGLLVVHDTGRGGEDDIAELTGREKLNNPLLELAETDVVAGGDDTALVHAAGTVSKPTSETFVCGMYSPAVELDNDLAAAVVVDLLELANVA
jgi:hypothetical protein